MAETPDDIAFLNYEQVLEIHASRLALYGGAEGFIDEKVVRSAAAAPAATMFGHYLNEDVAQMAAAYLCGFATAQGFRDGNKRTGAGCCHVFLMINGYDLDCSDEELYEVAMGAANKVMDKAAVADWIRDHMTPAEPLASDEEPPSAP